MKIYFYSPVKCVVRTDEGIFSTGKNITEKEIRSDEVVSVYPCVGQKCMFCLEYPQINENAAMTNFYDGLLFVPVIKPKPSCGYEILYEKTLSVYGTQYFVSVVADTNVKVTIKGYRSLKEVVCPFVPTEVETAVLKNAIAVQLKADVTKLVVFALPSLEVLLETTAKKIYLSDTIVTEKIFYGAFEYVCSVQYFLSPFSVIKRYLDKKGKPRNNRLIAGLGFFEVLNYGGDASEFLSDELRDKKEALKDFIPAWKYIVPPIKREYPTTFCLLGKTPTYAKLTFENDKITDIDVNDTPQ